MSVKLKTLTNDEALSKIFDIAQLRINVFKEFPYIYEGSLDYEVKYLGRYLKAKNACFFAAFNENEKLVGVATCLPLSEEDDFIKKPFLEQKIDLKKIFYFGESLLLSEYRGQGLGHQFFDLREKAARDFGAEICTFCAVKREENHALKPTNYRSHEKFWQSRGYEVWPDLKCKIGWQDLNETHETEKEMTFWKRSL